MSDIPEFLHITPERINALFTELMRPNPSENQATKWTKYREAVAILEREQARITRIHEAYYRGQGDPTPEVKSEDQA